MCFYDKNYNRYGINIENCSFVIFEKTTKIAGSVEKNIGGV